MKTRCLDALNAARTAAGGKPLSDAQALAIDERLAMTMRRLARADAKAWMAMPADQRMLLAAERVQQDIAEESARKIANAERQALKTAETEVRLREQRARMGFTRAEAWADDIQQADDAAHAISREYAAQLMKALAAAESTHGASILRSIGIRALGLDNPQMTLDIAREIHARGNAGTGNRLAIEAAKAFETVSEAQRTRLNASGGDVGRLKYGYMPNAWEPDLVLRAGGEKFTQVMIDKVDRSRYLRSDGSRMDDSEMREFLKAAAETIGTNGANDAAPGFMSGSAAMAKRGSEHREIHWKDGDAYIAAMREFGSGSMYDALMGHTQMMSRTIALVERYGPNPDAQHRLQKELAARDVTRTEAPLVAWSDLDHHWRVVAGTRVAQWEYTPPIVGAAIEKATMGAVSGRFTGAGVARFWQHVRNTEVIGKLQQTLLASFTDLPTYFATAGFNKLPYFDALINLPRSMTPVMRGEMVEFMNQQGLMADTLISNINRFTGENISASWSSHLSNATMKLSLTNWWTDGIRRSFALTMQQGVARWLKKDWGDLDEWTREVLLARRGLTEEDWKLMQSATATPTKWGHILTPEAIYATGDPRASQTVNRYLTVISHEQQMSAIEADVAARAFLRRGTEPGTLSGEGARLIGQFKAFPIALMTRHWRRILETPQGLEGAPPGFRGETEADSTVNRLAYFGAFLVSMTAAGAISYQAKQIVAGKDPVNMDPEDDKGQKFWLRALAQGGGLGFLGDVLLRDSADDRSQQQGLFELLGPVAGSLAQGYELTKGNLDEAAAGKDTHAGAEAIRFARGHAPLINLWYAKAAVDHAALNSLQENLSPGYLARVRNRAQKDWQQEFWWQPGDALPDRAPDLGVIAGQ